jgi:hypothetical protein
MVILSVPVRTTAHIQNAEGVVRDWTGGGGSGGGLSDDERFFLPPLPRTRNDEPFPNPIDLFVPSLVHCTHTGWTAVCILLLARFAWSFRGRSPESSSQSSYK